MASGFDAAKVLILFELGAKNCKIQTKALNICMLVKCAKSAKKIGKNTKKGSKLPNCNYLIDNR